MKRMVAGIVLVVACGKGDPKPEKTEPARQGSAPVVVPVAPPDGGVAGEARRGSGGGRGGTAGGAGAGVRRGWVGGAMQARSGLAARDNGRKDRRRWLGWAVIMLGGTLAIGWGQLNLRAIRGKR